MAEGGESEEVTLRSLFGDHIVKGDMLERIEIDDLGGEGKVVGVYVSGHWCPPCKQFTPVLAEWYERFKEGPNADNLEIIFVSSDKNEIDFMRYFMSMPWAALPFAERDRKTHIGKLFNIGGIPALVFINAANCELITNDGRAIVTEDVDGEDFPWMPVPVFELLEGELVNCADGNEASFDDIKGKTLGIYIAGQCSDDCKEFQSQLTDVYNQVNSKGKKFEIVLASSDRTPEDFEASIETMTWYALPFEDRRRKRLARVLKVQTVPWLVIVGEDGKVINEMAQTAIEQDPSGKEFPWYPKPVSELDDEAVEQINESPCVVLLTKSDDSSLSNARSTLEKVSEAYHKTLDDKDKAKKENKLILFYYGGASDEDDVGEQLRNFAELPNQTPLLAILDIPNSSKYICEKTSITSQVVSDFLKEYQNGKLPKEELEI